MLSLVFSLPFPAPIILSNTSLAQQTSITLTATLSVAGILWCRAFPVGVANISSTAEDFLRGATAAVSVANAASITLRGLLPLTQYLVVCLTQASQGTIQSLLSSLQRPVTTLCCRRVAFSLSSQVFALNEQPVLNALIVQIDPPGGPASDFGVSIFATGSTAQQQQQLFLPAATTFSAAEVALAHAQQKQLFFEASFFAPPGVVGSFSLGARLSRDNSSFSVSSASVTVGVAGGKTTTMTLVSAQFSDDGTRLALTLSAPYSGERGNTFNCASIFVFFGAAASTCQWTGADGTSVVAEGGLLVLLGSPVSLVSPSAANVVYVMAPSNPIVPSVSIRAADAFYLLAADTSGTNSSCQLDYLEHTQLRR
jgi:hypothetical protein